MTATAAAVASIAATAAATTIASHLLQLRIDVLLGLTENTNKIPGLLGVYMLSVYTILEERMGKGI